MDPGGEDVAPETFVAAYITAWVEHYRIHARYLLAITEIWANFRDRTGGGTSGPPRRHASWPRSSTTSSSGRPAVTCGPRVMAVSMKSALDALTGQLAADPEAYGAELAAVFERATRPGP